MLDVQKLKVELKARNLDTSGKKAELAERLESHLQAQPAEASTAVDAAITSSETAQATSTEPASSKVRADFLLWTADWFYSDALAT